MTKRSFILRNVFARSIYRTSLAKTVKIQVLIFALIVMCGNATAQFGGSIHRAAQRGAERAVEKKVEQKVEEAVSKELDKANTELEKVLDEAATIIEEVQKAQEEADAKIAEIPDEIPIIDNTPYTPSENEFAFFAMKKGVVQTMASKDDKGRITSQARNTVKEITGAKNAFAIHYESEILDNKGKPANKEQPFIIDYRIVVKDGIMYLDMKEMFGSMEGLDGIQASGKAMKIPSDLSVGQAIEDANAKVRIGFINCSVIMTEGKCLAIEDVLVEAGTFKCYKISQKTNTTAMGVKNEGTTITWYAKGVGAVKTETYDKKGKLTSIQELISIQN